LYCQSSSPYQESSCSFVDQGANIVCKKNQHVIVEARKSRCYVVLNRCPQYLIGPFINRSEYKRPLDVYILIYVWLYSSFVGLWPLSSFLILYTVGRTPRTGDQPVSRPLSKDRKQTKITAHRNPSFKWASNPRSQCWSEQRPALSMGPI
jgi:hypothetical protein